MSAELQYKQWGHFASPAESVKGTESPAEPNATLALQAQKDWAEGHKSKQGGQILQAVRKKLGREYKGQATKSWNWQQVW